MKKGMPMLDQGTLPGFGTPSIIKNPTPEQTAIIDAVRSGSGHILVEALAGTGKTSTILASLVAAPVKHVLLTSFAKGIVNTLNDRKPKEPRGSKWRASTLHRLGLGVLRSYGWKPDAKDAKEGIHKDTTEKLVSDMAKSIEEIINEDKRCGRTGWLELTATETATAAALYGQASVISDAVKKAAEGLVEHWKGACLDQDARGDVDLQIEAFDALSDQDAKIAETIATFAYAMGARLDRDKISYSDMIWLPLILGHKPKWKYDLVLVDEAQDLSRPQFEFAQQFLASDGRLVIVGDLKQSIYGWRGAVGREVWDAMRGMNARVMSLTTTFRCATSIVAVANELVPELRASKDAVPGRVLKCTERQLIAALPTIEVDTFVLSRSNAALFSIALQLWRVDAHFTFNKGKELARGLWALLNKLDTRDEERFRKSLDEWHALARAKAQEVSSTSKLDRVDQARDTLLALLTCKPPRELGALIERLSAERDAPVKLSTVHGTKGLEAERVFLVKETFARYQKRRIADGQLAPIAQEELNLEYVAITRAKHDLIWVDNDVVHDRSS